MSKSGGRGSWFGGLLSGGGGKKPPLTSDAPDLGSIVKNPPRAPPGKGGKPPPGGGKQPPVPPTPPKGGISATTGAGLAGGAGIAGLLAGSIPGIMTTVQAGIAADAATRVADTTSKVVEDLTEFLSRPEVIAGAVGITALIVLGPTIAAVASRK